MKTALLDGKFVSGFDRELMQHLAHLPAAPLSETVKVGIENEFGQIYRIIETGNLLANEEALAKLRAHGFFVVPLDPVDDYSVLAIVKLQEE
ncbi:hypothetical protein SAMN06265795_103114 [Noviherbaspirillum humi]|uniref:Uncharacterized protein n=1 Tax=Noviherbaspirillum humi TaxID=1688639 RepID=A0A239F2D7_9BURK|nr:hypothetical protein [Noviherbaspirillum humi]SNS50433.1 hypothetical protein SAMN06265795_103114 [Noviherbaspirillum humi]